MTIHNFKLSQSVFRIQRLFLLFFLIFFIQCEDSDEEIGRLKQELSLERVKNALWNAKDSVNLITDIRQQSNRVIISFESGDSLVIPSSFIDEPKADSAKWKMTITFMDGSTILSPMIGTLYTGSVNYESVQGVTLIGYMFTSDVFLNPKIIEVDDANTIMFEADFSPDMANYRALKFDLYQNFQY